MRERPVTLFKKRLWYKCFPLLKERLWQRCFPVNFAKFLRTAFFTELLWWLLLLLDEIQNTKKMQTRESKETKFEKKVREIGCVVLIFI